MFPRVNYHFGHQPGSYKDYLAQERRDFVDLKWVYLANWGVWEAIYSAGPCVGVAHTREDVWTYLNAVRGLVEEFGYEFK